VRTISRFFHLFRKNKLDADMAEEMRLHLDLQTEHNIASGMDATEARYAAERQFGNISSLQQRAREQRGWRWLEEVTADLKFAGRMLLKHPGFTVASVSTLALGIGFVSTLYTVVNGVAFGQLPFDDAERIVSIDVPASQYDEYLRRQQSCETFAFVQPMSANLRAGALVSRYSAAVVSANFLAVLQTGPTHGRGFMPEDALAGASRTVLIAHSVWQREFDGDKSVVGAEVKVNGETHSIIGVMPEGFGFPFNQEVWVARLLGEPIDGGIVFGKLAPGVSARRASDQFTALAQTLGPVQNGSFVWNSDIKAEPATKERVTPVAVVPFAERSVKTALRMMLSSILAATFLVLLLACANVANLVLARSIDRRKELAVRAALGASRGRLIRQMMTESFLVSLLGAVGGLLIAAWSSRALWLYMMKERPLTGGAPFWINFDLDSGVFAFVAFTTIVASVATGLVPALRASKIDVNDALKDGAGGGLRVSGFSRLLMNGQMAFSVCLVTIAGLFVSVLIAFNHKSLPYDPATIFTARVSLDERRYDDLPVRQQFFDRLLARLAATPGVDAAALHSAESMRRSRVTPIAIEGATYEGRRPECSVDTVSPGFLDTFGVGLLSGRAFRAADRKDTTAVAIVNTAFVERFGRDQDFVGKRFRVSRGDSDGADWITIIGVAPDLGSVKAGEASRGAVIYRPLPQETDRAMTILLRGKGDPARFIPLVRRAVAELDPDLPVARLQTMKEIIELERIGMNAFGTLFVACGMGALVLASVGIYGVISFTVKLRTREFGVRLALGAHRAAITRMVVLQGVRQISIGLSVGAVLAVLAAAFLRSMFIGFGHSAYDVWIYVGVLMLLASVAGMALFIPARRAANVDPMVALRAD
jgi:putative ABC transport system permease protein